MATTPVHGLRDNKPKGGSVNSSSIIYQTHPIYLRRQWPQSKWSNAVAHVLCNCFSCPRRMRMMRIQVRLICFCFVFFRGVGGWRRWCASHHAVMETAAAFIARMQNNRRGGFVLSSLFLRWQPAVVLVRDTSFWTNTVYWLNGEKLAGGEGGGGGVQWVLVVVQISHSRGKNRIISQVPSGR